MACQWTITKNVFMHGLFCGETVYNTMQSKRAKAQQLVSWNLPNKGCTTQIDSGFHPTYTVFPEKTCVSKAG